LLQELKTAPILGVKPSAQTISHKYVTYLAQELCLPAKIEPFSSQSLVEEFATPVEETPPSFLHQGEGRGTDFGLMPKPARSRSLGFSAIVLFSAWTTGAEI